MQGEIKGLELRKIQFQVIPLSHFG